MLLRLWSYCTGHLLIEVQGGWPERFLNLAMGAEIGLWDIRRTAGGVRARLFARDFFRLRPPVRAARCRVRLLRRRGLPFLLRRLRGRHGLLAGAALCALLVWFLSGHVWFVEVRGQGLVDPRAVQFAAARLGLYPGAWKRRINLAALERRLPHQVEGLAWAAVAVRGTRAIIEVVELQRQRRPPPGRVDIVAARDGVVQRVLVLRGRGRVQEGDVVRAGQVLIEGVLAVAPGLPVPITKPQPEPQVLGELAAEGSVQARRWYREYEEVPLFREERQPTGRTWRRLVLRRAGREIISLGRQNAPFAAFDARERTLRPRWRKLDLAVELAYFEAKEVRVQRHPFSLAAAAREAEERFVRRVRWHLGRGDTLVAVRSAVVQRGTDFVGLALLAETLEEIGRPVAAGPAQGGNPGID